LHAAVEATDAPPLEAAPFTALLPDPESRSRVESAAHDSDITHDVVHEARRGVRSVLDEARAEIEALSSEAPAMLAESAPPEAPARGDGTHTPAAGDEPQVEDAQDRIDAAAAGPLGEESAVDELSIDASLAAVEV